MNTKEKKIYNVDNAWKNLHARFEEDGLLTTDNKIKKFDFLIIKKIAAIFIVGVLISFLAYYSIGNNTHNRMQLAETYADDDIKIIELSDGSVVHINKESNLYYPKKFSKNQRVVELEGEAFFDVKRNLKKPFIIKARNTEIMVLGTSFNVNTKFEGKKVEVYVKTGKVKFYEPGNTKKNLILASNFVGTIDKTAKKKLNENPNYISWKTKYFDFSKGEKLSKIISCINRAYGVNIILEDKKIAEKIQKTTYDNNSLDSILKIICKTYNLSVKRQEETIILKSN